jgi:hypothetical protein
VQNESQRARVCDSASAGRLPPLQPTKASNVRSQRLPLAACPPHAAARTETDAAAAAKTNTLRALMTDRPEGRAA